MENVLLKPNFDNSKALYKNTFCYFFFWTLGKNFIS